MVFLKTLAFLTLSAVSSAHAEKSVSKTVNELGPVVVGQPFPIFAGFTLEDEFFAYKSIQSEYDVIIVSYFATWCGSCKVGMPHIEKIAQSNTKVASVFVNFAETELQKIEKFTKEIQISSPVVLDKQRVFATKHGVVTEGSTAELPKTFVIDKNNNVVAIYVVEGSDFHEHLEAVVNKLLETTSK